MTPREIKDYVIQKIEPGTKYRIKNPISDLFEKMILVEKLNHGLLFMTKAGYNICFTYLEVFNAVFKNKEVEE